MMDYKEYRLKGMIIISFSIICIIISQTQFPGVKQYLILGCVLSIYGIYWSAKYIEVERKINKNRTLATKNIL
jgi:hypothetical protein